MALRLVWPAVFAVAFPALMPGGGVAQQPSDTVGAQADTAAARRDTVAVERDSIMVRLVNADIRSAVRALARHLDRPVVFGDLRRTTVTLETPRPVPLADVHDLLAGLLRSQGFELVPDSGLYRVRESPEPRRRPAESAQASNSAGDLELWVIRLTHARADDVAATVNALYGQATALDERGTGPTTLTTELGDNRIALSDPARRGREGPGGRDNSLARGRFAAFASDVNIIPDAGTNSLLVRATRRDFELVQAAVNELDLRPLQVMIEVLIAEVRRDRRYSFGLELGLDTTTVPGHPETTVSGSNAGLGLGDFVLDVMNLGGTSLSATLRAAAGRGDVRIVSRPVLLAANNETADILVGSQRPFVQVSRSLPTDVPSRDQVIQYKDVGTRLSIHPTISADGYVMLDVTQEVNAATTETAFDAPVISTRSVETRLLVKDGQTAVLGGLNDQQEDRTEGGIPLLKDIPLIGALFGSTNRRSIDTELLIFLTPTVLSTDEDVNEVTDSLRQNAEAVKR